MGYRQCNKRKTQAIVDDVVEGERLHGCRGRKVGKESLDDGGSREVYWKWADGGGGCSGGGRAWLWEWGV
jgi:hypothetical protein